MMALQTQRCGSRQSLGDKCERAIDHLVDLGFVPQNAIDVELCPRITNGTPALAHLIIKVESMFGQMQSARPKEREACHVMPKPYNTLANELSGNNLFGHSALGNSDCGV